MSYKRFISFRDCNDIKITVEIEHDDNRSHPYWAFRPSMPVETIVPCTKPQKILVEIIKKLHLSGMSAGTPEQDKFLKDNDICNDYERRCDALEEAGLLTVKYKDEDYKYGHGWIYKPINNAKLIKLLDKIRDELIEEMKEEQGEREITEDDTELFESFDDPDEAHALALMLELSVNDIPHLDNVGANRYDIYEKSYLCGDDEEMDKMWEESLETLYTDFYEYEVPEIIRPYIDVEKWINDAKCDGRGSTLSSYDSCELEIKFNDKWYYAYREG